MPSAEYASVIDRGNEDVQVPNFAPGIRAPTSTGTYNVLQVHACTGTGMLGWRVVWAPGTWELELGDDNKDDKAAE